ncbi:MAG TPA: FtsX-like permease family protein [Gemmatimonadales bacterium]|nr:FtsX-like permease family protein [Gemmatimonadales bacterium]
MLLLKLALRNLLGAGIRTWLNVVALSFSFVAIVFLQGMYDGMNEQASQASVGALYGGGQYWQARYDPYDPLTLPDAHALVPPALDSLVARGLATPILVRQASIYPGGRFRGVLLKGIAPGQRILTIPSAALAGGGGGGTIPALVGARMARSTGLAPGDPITVQWRDAHGTFDAADVRIAAVMRTTVQEIDVDQIWIPLETLRRLTGMAGEASLLVLRQGAAAPGPVAGWSWKSQDWLLRDIRALKRLKSIDASILYAFLLFLAMLAIFDTQVLSIFRRRREIGTLMALGMTRVRVIGLFTIEGALNGALAAVLAAAYGLPLLTYVAVRGYGMPQGTDSFGLAVGERIYPIYPAALVVGTAALVLLVTTVVSYLPSRRIAKLRPTDALRGRTA